MKLKVFLYLVETFFKKLRIKFCIFSSHSTNWYHPLKRLIPVIVIYSAFLFNHTEIQKAVDITKDRFSMFFIEEC